MLLHVVFENLNSHVWVIYLQVKNTSQSLMLPLTQVLAISFDICRFRRVWSVAASNLLIFFPSFFSLSQPSYHHPPQPRSICTNAVFLLI